MFVLERTKGKSLPKLYVKAILNSTKTKTLEYLKDFIMVHTEPDEQPLLQVSLNIFQDRIKEIYILIGAFCLAEYESKHFLLNKPTSFVWISIRRS